MSAQNPTIALVYQKNLPKEKVKSHWLVSTDGLAAKQFFLKPQEHKRRARKCAFIDACTWIQLTYPESALVRTKQGIFTNQSGNVAGKDRTQDLEEMEVLA